MRLLEFDGGEARLIEVTLAAKSPAAGRPISQLGVPRGATVVAVVRGGHVIVPHGDAVLLAGDEVLALVTSAAEDAVKGILVCD